MKNVLADSGYLLKVKRCLITPMMGVIYPDQPCILRQADPRCRRIVGENRHVSPGEPEIRSTSATHLEEVE
ncbi:hypothetical protein A2U01_0047242, partial [Trifolium medium]|nr:hypothetical protein [Trifolium medium]